MTSLRELSLKAAGREMGRDTSTLRRLIESGQLKAYREGSRWRIPEWAIREYQEEQAKEARAKQQKR